jgi:DNA-binding NarL/FixJ family response regulator
MPGERIIIVDDHALAREGLRSALSSSGYEVLCAVGTGEEALSRVAELQPDLLLLDIRLGAGMDGLEAARRVSGLGLKTRIMMLTLHDDPDYIRAALQAGAAGYVLKDASLEELRTAVRQVLSGATAIPSALLSSVLMRSDRDTPDSDLIDRLTEREREVLDRIAKGLTNKAIARELEISPATVKAHVERVIAKLGVTDRTQAAVMVTRWREARR